MKTLDEKLVAALEKIGAIVPWHDEDVSSYVFEHAEYPLVRYAGETPEEVIQNYPLYLRDYLEEEAAGNVSPLAVKVFGRGGTREGAGRPVGTTKAPTKMVRLPVDLAVWLKADPRNIELTEKLMEG